MSARTLVNMTDDDNMPSFARPFNDVPIFSVDSMPLSTSKNPDAVKMLNKMVSSSYAFFSAQAMWDILDQIVGKEGPTSEDHLWSLVKVILDMQKQSTVDYRSMVWVPAAPVMENGTMPDMELAKQLRKPESFVYQTFFRPLFEQTTDLE